MEEPKKTSYSEYYKSLNRDKFSQKEKQITQDKQPGKPEYSPKYTPSIKKYYATKEKESINIPLKKEYEEGTVKEKPKLSPQEYNRIIASAKSSGQKTNRTEKTIIVIIYAIVFLIAGYFIIASIFPDKLPFSSDTYTIKAGDIQIFNTLKSFYIDNPNVLGDKKHIDGIVVQPIISSNKFNVVLTPKKTITKENATLFLDFILNKENGSNVYLNERLIFPNLDNYKLINENEKDYVYLRNDTFNNSSNNEVDYLNYVNAEDLIYEHFPGASVWATRKLAPVDVFLEDYKDNITEINAIIRDSLHMAVYAENNLRINFTKQDLNINLGEDQYNVTITDNYGDIIYNEFFDDDGNKLDNGSIGIEQNFSIEVDNLADGIYYIDFMRDKNNKWEDSTIKNIKMNTNKVLFVGTFLLWSDDFNFYTKNYHLKSWLFTYYWGGKKDIFVNGSEMANLTLKNIGENYRLNFTKPGDYNISIPKGQIWIAQSMSSPAKENWFDIPVDQMDNFNNQVIVVIDRELFNKEAGEIKYSKSIKLNPKQTQITLRALEKNVVNIKEIKLVV